jgi:hypothetical protein
VRSVSQRSGHLGAEEGEGYQGSSPRLLSPHRNGRRGSMTLEDEGHAFRLLPFRRAQEVGKVSAACLELGVSHSLYYQRRKRFVRDGPDGLHPKRRRGRPGRPLRATPRWSARSSPGCAPGRPSARSSWAISWRCGASGWPGVRSTGRCAATASAPGSRALCWRLPLIVSPALREPSLGRGRARAACRLEGP